MCTFQHASWDWGGGADGTGSRDSSERAELGKGEMSAPVHVPPAELHIHERSPMASHGRDCLGGIEGAPTGKESGQGK